VTLSNAFEMPLRVRYGKKYIAAEPLPLSEQKLGDHIITKQSGTAL